MVQALQTMGYYVDLITELHNVCADKVEVLSVARKLRVDVIQKRFAYIKVYDPSRSLVNMSSSIKYFLRWATKK